jgi:hypothetical protein
MPAAASRPVAAESVVLIATSVTSPGAAPVNRRLPLAFRPIHPSQVKKQASRNSTAL